MPRTKKIVDVFDAVYERCRRKSEVGLDDNLDSGKSGFAMGVYDEAVGGGVLAASASSERDVLYARRFFASLPGKER